MNDSTAYADLVAALGALDDLPRDKTAKVETRGGGSYSYNYADLAGALGAVRPVLAAHHFAVIQPVASHEGVVTVWTELVHASGVRFESPCLTMRQPESPQALGSTITYLRRYSLLAALGLATEDDDGRAASEAPSRETPREMPGPTDTQRGAAMKLANDLGWNRDERLAQWSEWLGRDVDTFNDLDRLEATRVIDLMRRETVRRSRNPLETAVAVADADDELDADLLREAGEAGPYS